MNAKILFGIIAVSLLMVTGTAFACETDRYSPDHKMAYGNHDTQNNHNERDNDDHSSRYDFGGYMKDGYSRFMRMGDDMGRMMRGCMDSFRWRW